MPIVEPSNRCLVIPKRENDNYYQSMVSNFGSLSRLSGDHSNAGADYPVISCSRRDAISADEDIHIC